MDNIVRNKKKINGIPVLEYFPAAKKGTKLPLVFILHGFTGRKENCITDLEEYARGGYYAVAPDHREHGKRRTLRFFTKVLKGIKINMAELMKLVKESADDYISLIDHYEKHDCIDPGRIGVAGVSMGGCITYRMMVIDSRIKTAAPMISTPHWGDLPEDRKVSNDPIVMKSLDSFARLYSPDLYPDKFYPRPLLMQIGENDRHFAAVKVKKFYEKLKPFYNQEPDKLEYVLYKNTGHEITPAMLSKTAGWFKKWL